MIRAVFDANVFASGVLRFEQVGSTPGTLLRIWSSRMFELVTSDRLIAEIERTLAKPYFAENISPAAAGLLVAALHEQATRTDLTVEIRGVASHSEDDFVLAAAVSAEVDYLVTGDRQLQRLGSYQEVIIVSPRDFLSLLEKSRESSTINGDPDWASLNHE